MPKLPIATLKRQATKVSGALRGGSSRRKAAMAFAKKHHLIYFQSVNPEHDDIPVILGSTASPDQVDSNICIGSHAGYDLVLLERLSRLTFDGYKPSLHRWYVLQIDLKRAQTMPFIFVGTKLQSKTYYARLLTAHREIRPLSLTTNAEQNASFHSHYSLLASPAELNLVYDLFTDTVIDTIAGHHRSFALEIDGDSVMVIGDATAPSAHVLNEMLHYGLWIAKEIDERIAGSPITNDQP